MSARFFCLRNFLRKRLITNGTRAHAHTLTYNNRYMRVRIPEKFNYIYIQGEIGNAGDPREKKGEEKLVRIENFF